MPRQSPDRQGTATHSLLQNSESEVVQFKNLGSHYAARADETAVVMVGVCLGKGRESRMCV